MSPPQEPTRCYLSARLAGARGRLITELSRAVTDWGGQVPEDPPGWPSWPSSWRTPQRTSTTSPPPPPGPNCPVRLAT